MLKHAVTLGMFVMAGLVFAIGTSAPTTIVGLTLFTVAISTEVAAWRRVVRVRRADTGPARR